MLLLNSDTPPSFQTKYFDAIIFRLSPYVRCISLLVHLCFGCTDACAQKLCDSAFKCGIMGRGKGLKGKGSNKGSQKVLKPPRHTKPRPGDWICGTCDAHNFSKRSDCFFCHNDITSDTVRYDPDIHGSDDEDKPPLVLTPAKDPYTYHESSEFGEDEKDVEMAEPSPVKSEQMSTGKSVPVTPVGSPVLTNTPNMVPSVAQPPLTPVPRFIPPSSPIAPHMLESTLSMEDALVTPEDLRSATQALEAQRIHILQFETRRFELKGLVKEAEAEIHRLDVAMDVEERVTETLNKRIKYLKSALSRQFDEIPRPGGHRSGSVDRKDKQKAPLSPLPPRHSPSRFRSRSRSPVKPKKSSKSGKTSQSKSGQASSGRPLRSMSPVQPVNFSRKRTDKSQGTSSRRGASPPRSPRQDRRKVARNERSPTTRASSRDRIDRWENPNPSRY